MYKIILAIVTAFVLWFLTFVIKPFNFWAMMYGNGCVLIALSGWFFPFKSKPRFKDLLIGIGSALILYAIFFIGNKLLIFLNQFFPWFVPNRIDNLQSVYQSGGQAGPVLIAAILFFIIGPAEEIFWRGSIQKYFAKKHSPYIALLLSTFFYTVVHLPTLNPLLLIAALVCGLFWGFLYLKTGSIWAVIFSHAIWDPLIFVLFPVV